MNDDRTKLVVVLDVFSLRCFMKNFHLFLILITLKVIERQYSKQLIQILSENIFDPRVLLLTKKNILKKTQKMAPHVLQIAIDI